MLVSRMGVTGNRKADALAKSVSTTADRQLS